MGSPPAALTKARAPVGTGENATLLRAAPTELLRPARRLRRPPPARPRQHSAGRRVEGRRAPWVDAPGAARGGVALDGNGVDTFATDAGRRHRVRRRGAERFRRGCLQRLRACLQLRWARAPSGTPRAPVDDDPCGDRVLAHRGRDPSSSTSPSAPADEDARHLARILLDDDVVAAKPGERSPSIRPSFSTVGHLSGSTQRRLQSDPAVSAQGAVCKQEGRGGPGRRERVGSRRPHSLCAREGTGGREWPSIDMRPFCAKSADVFSFAERPIRSPCERFVMRSRALFPRAHRASSRPRQPARNRTKPETPQASWKHLAGRAHLEL